MTIGRPAGNVDTSLVASVEVQSASLGTGLTVVEEAGLVLSDRHEEAAVGAVPDAVDEVAVIGGSGSPFERRALMPGHSEIFSARHDTERLLRPVVASSDGLGVTSNGTPARTSLGIKNISHPVYKKRGYKINQKKKGIVIRDTYFSLPLPTATTCLLSGDQAMSKIAPPRALFSSLSLKMVS